MEIDPKQAQSMIESGIREIERLANEVAPGLARSWQALYPDMSNRDLVGLLEQKIGHGYPPNRISEWRHNDRRIPPVVQRVMREDILSFVLSSRPTAKRLQDVIEPPPRNDDA